MTLSRPELLAALAVALLLAAASWLGLAQALGAHPWWAARSGAIGGGLMLLIYLPSRALGLPPKPIALAAGLSLIIALLAAHFGKATFIAADDFRPGAGRAWYLGTIAAWINLGLLLTALAATRLSRRRNP
jgi:hypothetical protein